MRSAKPLLVPVQMRTRAAYLTSSSQRNTYLGGYVGIMLVMAVYNLFIFLSIRDRSYMFYVLYILSVLAAQLAFVGIAPVVVAPSLTFLASKASILLTTVTAICASEFLRHFLHTTNGCQVSPGRPVGSTRPLGSDWRSTWPGRASRVTR
ncbi:MAG: 7TM-DISM domain-containing protein [Flavobacteriales bacterium]